MLHNLTAAWRWLSIEQTADRQSRLPAGDRHLGSNNCLSAKWQRRERKTEYAHSLPIKSVIMAQAQTLLGMAGKAAGFFL